jgi:hypothetical protein
VSAAESETQDQGKSIVHGSQLASIEAADGRPKPLWIHDGGLLDEDPRFLAVQLDRRPERGRTGTCRGWRDENRTQGNELIGLDDDRVTGTSLLTPACASRRRQAEYIAANHFSRAISGRG